MSLFSLRNAMVQIETKTILAPLSLDINSGDFLTITGPSGSGKSTLLQVLLGFRPLSKGNVLFQGNALEIKEIQKLRTMTSVVFQEPMLFGETIEDALRAPQQYKQNHSLQISEEKIEDTLHKLEIKHSVDHEIQNLSGGEKQRIALARALIFDRPILVLDEITSALDEANRDLVFKILQEQKRTVICVSHDPKWISLSPSLLKLKKGGEHE